ncbi:AAA family ATPase [candidate division WWE3 bacterium]|nr:AAA family ATPase [candidate division WWE3 bacterium]
MTEVNLQKYISNQVARAPEMLKIYTEDTSGEAYLKRDKFSSLLKLIEDFTSKESDVRVIGIPGLRGTGKTTLLAQLYLHLFPDHPGDMLFISADELVEDLNTDLFTIFKEYEKYLGTPFAELDRDIFIFIDEIQFDPKWASALKILYDRSRRVFVLCTGSSALSLQSNTDAARRILFQKLFPLSFPEYMRLKSKYASIKDPSLSVKDVNRDLRNSLKDALFYSENASMVHENLLKVNDEVKEYWKGIDTLELGRYLRFGTMPYSLKSLDNQRLLNLTDSQIDRVIERDLPELGKFDTSTLSSVRNVLLLLAGSTEVSITNLSNNLAGMSAVTLRNVLEALEKAELLIRVYPYGSSSYKKVRKPSKYHFMSPAIRHVLLSLLEGELSFSKHKGNYLEDAMALYLHRIFSSDLISPIFYDSSKGGADFLINLVVRRIVLEVGMGHKGVEQVLSTLERTKSTYGLVVSDSDLSLKGDVVKVPLEFFLLL